MSHQIKETDLTFSILSAEWHGLANVVEAINRTVIQPILYRILSLPIFVPRDADGEIDENGGTFDKVKGHRYLFADLRHRDETSAFPLPEQDRLWPIAPARESYEVIDNIQSFDFMEKLLDGIEARIVTAGTLDNQSVFYVSAEEENSDWKGPRNDSFVSHINLVTSHNGTVAFTPHDSATRIVCMNTLNVSLAGAGDLRSVVRHTANAEKYMGELAQWFNATLKQRQDLRDNLHSFDSIAVSRREAESFVSLYYAGVSIGWDVTNPKHETGLSEFKLSTRAKNQVDGVIDLFRNGKGNRGATVYDIWNGVTDHYTNGGGTGMDVETPKAKRWAKSEHGAARNHKADFTRFLIDSVSNDRFADDCERGERILVNTAKAN